MELLNSINTKIKTIVIILIVLGLIIFFGLKFNNFFLKETLHTSSSTIELLLNQSNSFLGNSLIVAEENAQKALKLAQNENRPQYIIDAWILLGKIQCLKGNNNKALDFFTASKKAATNIQYSKGISIANFEIGNVYYTWGEYEKSLIYFKISDSIATTNNLVQQKIDATNYIGKYFRTTGNFRESIKYFEKSLKLSRQINDYKQIAVTLNYIGKYYISEGKVDLALHSYLEAYNATEHFNDKIIYSEVCNHLGGIYLQINEYAKALEYHKKALNCRNSIQTPEGIAKSYNNIGKAFLELQQIDSAELFFRHSYEICKTIGYKKGIVKALINLGKVKTIQNKNEEAKNYLFQSLNIANDAGYDLGIAESSLALGNYYLKKNDVEDAINYFNLSLQKVKNTNFDDIIHDIYLGLYVCYSSKDDTKKALDYHILLSDIEKKLLNVENNKQISLLQISFESERKEKDNQVLRKDNELKEMTIKRKNAFLWLIVVALISFIILSILLWVRFSNKRIANLKIQQQNNELEKLNIELERVNHEKDKFFSIVSHELRNPLYWFQNLTELLSKKYHTMPTEKVQKTLSALDESAKNAYHLMDNLLNWSRSKLNRITPKKNNLQLSSLILETTHMFETIIQHKEIDFEVSIDSHQFVYVDSDLFNCIIRNLLSNAIKYTFSGGKISIKSTEDNDFITIMIYNSGEGIPENISTKIFDSDFEFSEFGLMNEKGTGLGLKLCKEFVELNKGHIWVKSENGVGTTFSFTVPNAKKTN